eukprot:scaffold310178_cov30-Tisochrysis_lutea.AAC.1
MGARSKVTSPLQPLSFAAFPSVSRSLARLFARCLFLSLSLGLLFLRDSLVAYLSHQLIPIRPLFSSS